MDIPNNTSLPFFAYGTFKPRQLGFYRIADYVEKVETNCTVRGALLERDGLPIVDKDGNSEVLGSLIFFKQDGAAEAYRRIIEIEPDKHYQWGVANTRTEDASVDANILYGRPPKKDSIRFEGTEWDGSKDPLFTAALDVVKETLEANAQIVPGSLENDLKPLFRLQAAYLLLWSVIERYVSLRYHLGDKVMGKIQRIAEEDVFIESLKQIVKEQRSILRADEPGKEVTLNPANPKNSILYYYQVRSNIAHRGKAVVKDFRVVKSSLEELYEIFIRVKEKAFSTLETKF